MLGSSGSACGRGRGGRAGASPLFRTSMGQPLTPLRHPALGPARTPADHALYLHLTRQTPARESLAYAVTGSGANPAGPADFVGGAYPSGTIALLRVNQRDGRGLGPGKPRRATEPRLHGPLSSPAGAAITVASADGLIRTDDAARRQPPCGPVYARGDPAPVVSSRLTALAARRGRRRARSHCPAGLRGTFRTPVAGVANAAVALAPAAGASLALPAGYDALAVQGGGAVTLSDAGAAGAVLVGNAAGDTFASTGADAVLTGGAGNDTFFVSGRAQVTPARTDTLFASGAASGPQLLGRPDRGPCRRRRQHRLVWGRRRRGRVTALGRTTGPGSQRRGRGQGPKSWPGQPSEPHRPPSAFRARRNSARAAR